MTGHLFQCTIAFVGLLVTVPFAGGISEKNGSPTSCSYSSPECQIVGNPLHNADSLNVIEAYIAASEYTKAEPLLRQYLQEHPSSSKAHYDLGYLLFRIHDEHHLLFDSIRESIKELSACLAIDTRNAEAHKILALDLTMIGRDDLAGTELKEAIRLSPESAEIHYLLGRHFMGQTDYGRAQRELEAAVRLDLAYTKAYENLGITLHYLGENKSALEMYRRAVELSEAQGSGAELPYLELAKFYHDENEMTLSEQFARKALRENPRSDQACYELGRVYRDQSRWAEAADALEKAVALNPREPQYYFLLGRTYDKLGQHDRSKDAFAEYVKHRNATP